MKIALPLICVICLCAPFGRTQTTAQSPATPNADSSASITQRGVLFDFPWSGELHQFFDAKDEGALAKTDAILETWIKRGKNASFEIQALRAQLVLLMKQDDESLRISMQRLVSSENTTWSLLLALEQMELRLGGPQSAFRTELEELIKNRCERFLIAYLKNAYTTKEISLRVCQAVSRMRDDRVALKLLEQASKAIELRGGSDNLPIAILESERLLSLASSDEAFKSRAYSSFGRLCELLENDPEHLKSHPLALAKARRTLATLESDEERRVVILKLAVEDLADTRLATDSIPERWLWEARRELKNPAGLTESQQAEMLLRYRRETLKAASLLDGYSLCGRRDKGQKSAECLKHLELFSVANVEASLKTLTQLQRSFKVSGVDQLRTLFSLASIRGAIESRDTQETLDNSMTLAWSLTKEQSLNSSSRRMVYECIVAWIESHVKNGILTAKQQQLLPSADLAIETLKNEQEFEQHVDLVKRLRKSQLALKLARDCLSDVIQLIDDSRSRATLEPLLLDSLELLLAIRASDLAGAEVLRESIECTLKSVTDPEAKLLPLYALSEYEVEYGMYGKAMLDWDQNPIARLNKAIEELDEKGVALKGGTLSRYKLGNQLHIAIASLQIGSTSEVIPDHPLQTLLEKTEKSFDTHDKGKEGDSIARRILLRIVESAEGKRTEIHRRAAVALAADKLMSIKSSVAKRSDEANEKRQVEYNQGKVGLKLIEEKADGLRRELDNIAQNARKEIGTGKNRVQFDVFESEYRKKEVDLERAIEQIGKKQNELTEIYDKFFRVVDLLPSDLETKQLQENLDLLICFIESALADQESSGASSNLLYNAKCVAVETALFLKNEEFTQVERKLLDLCAESLPRQALKIRQTWIDHKSPADNGNPNYKEMSDRVFGRYQLGFELAVRWLVSEHAVKSENTTQLSHVDSVRDLASSEPDQASLQKAINVVAKNTNRSFVDFTKGSSSTEIPSERMTDGEDFDFKNLPRNFIAYFSGSESLHVFWRFGDQEIQHGESSVNRTTLDSAVHQLVKDYSNKDAISTDTDLELISRLLSGWLLPRRLCSDLNLARSPEKDPACIYIAPHGPIFRLPLEGLSLIGVESLSSEEPDKQAQAMFGERYALIYLPTLEESSRLKRRDDLKLRRGVLSIQPDRYAGNESSKVLSLGSPSMHLHQSKCNLENVVNCLGNPTGWEIVHFGSHGVGDKSSKDAANSGSTSQAKTEQTASTTTNVDAYIELINDEKLATRDLVRNFLSEPPVTARTTPLSISHVFLSVCEANTVNASDLLAGGNTHKTLCTTFLAIGAGDVIASHWKVDAESTKAIFEEISTQYQQPATSTTSPSTEDVARMLFNARNHVRRRGIDNPNRNKNHDWHAPYFWNAFTIWSATWTP